MKNNEAKQKAIQEAYGEYWDKAKYLIDSDGWFIREKGINIKEISYDLEFVTHQRFADFYRPKSLQGIEDNNDWIRIESEEDLPKGMGIHWFANSQGVGANNLNSQEIKQGYDAGLITHYQTAQKPKSPIY